MIGPVGENLVFLLSTPRAGSTLASAILASHPDVASPNEPWFLLGLSSLYEGGNVTYAKYEHGGVEQALQELLSEEEFTAAARAFALAAYEQVLQRTGKRVFVDKTPRYFHITKFLQRLFPAAKIVWLKRNPLDVAVSYRDSWDVPVERLFDPTAGPMALDLTLGLRLLRSFADARRDSLELRYEDLVHDPETEVRRLCNHVGVAYVPELEAYGRDADALRARGSLSMGDTKLFDHARPHALSVGRWEQALTTDEVQRILCCLGAELLHRMGYTETVDALLARGFWFPSEDTVADTVSEFANAARWLPWAPRHD